MLILYLLLPSLIGEQREWRLEYILVCLYGLPPYVLKWVWVVSSKYLYFWACQNTMKRPFLGGRGAACTYSKEPRPYLDEGIAGCMEVLAG